MQEKRRDREERGRPLGHRNVNQKNSSSGHDEKGVDTRSLLTYNPEDLAITTY